MSGGETGAVRRPAIARSSRWLHGRLAVTAAPVALAAALLPVLLLRFPGLARRIGLLPASPAGATTLQVNSPVTGRVAALTVREGDAVRRGAVVALVEAAGGRLPPGTATGTGSAETALDEFRLAARREEVRRVREQYEAALRRLQQARAERDLLRAGTRPEQLRRFEAWLQEAEAHLALVREGPRAEQIARLRAAYEQARARLALLREGPRPEQV